MAKVSKKLVPHRVGLYNQLSHSGALCEGLDSILWFNLSKKPYPRLAALWCRKLNSLSCCRESLHLKTVKEIPPPSFQTQ